MKQLQFSSRAEWRRWLKQNHDQEPNGIWLVLQKKKSGKPSLSYQESVEEALCYGWIDSIVKRLDEEKYCRKFTPRRNRSVWSNLNKRRVEKIIKEGRMTRIGLAKVEAAKQSGIWNRDWSAVIPTEVPKELLQALLLDAKAKEFFETLPPSCRKQYIAWIAAAKKAETKNQRIHQCLALLAKSQKLGPK